jgi:hypothetical protein
MLALALSGSKRVYFDSSSSAAAVAVAATFGILLLGNGVWDAGFFFI